MVSTDLSVLEIAALVGPMELIPCEHSQHDKMPEVHDGNATMYAKGACPECKAIYTLFAVCQPWADYSQLKSTIFICQYCNNDVHAVDTIRIVGPVNGLIS